MSLECQKRKSLRHRVQMDCDDKRFFNHVLQEFLCQQKFCVQVSYTPPCQSIAGTPRRSRRFDLNREFLSVQAKRSGTATMGFRCVRTPVP